MSIPAVPAIVPGEVMHRRRVERADHFSYASLHWLVDVDDLPTVRIGRTRYDLDPADHLRGNGIRHDLDELLIEAGQQVLGNDTVLLFAQPRVAGKVFDPLSVLWVYDSRGDVRVMVLEVHNTYGERHAYVLPGAQQRHRVDKEFYVSPFNDPSGEYRVSWTLDDGALRVTVNLHRDGALVLAATVGGPLQPLTSTTMRSALRRVPGRSWRVPALIRWRGVLLWARRLKVQRRPENGGNLSRPAETPSATRP